MTPANPVGDGTVRANLDVEGYLSTGVPDLLKFRLATQGNPYGLLSRPSTQADRSVDVPASDEGLAAAQRPYTANSANTSWAPMRQSGSSSP